VAALVLPLFLTGDLICNNVKISGTSQEKNIFRGGFKCCQGRATNREFQRSEKDDYRLQKQTFLSTGCQNHKKF